MKDHSPPLGRTWKLKDVRVYGHNRSGTHYMASLIVHNFFSSHKYREIMCKREHHIPNITEKWIPKKRKVNVYIWRNQQETLKSLWNIWKNHPIIEADSFENFINTPYIDMYHPEFNNVRIESCVLRMKDEKSNVVSSKNSTRGIPILPEGDRSTPINHWNNHVSTWAKLAQKRDDIIIISYDKLIKEEVYYQKILEKIGEKLGSTKKKFIDVKNTVGWVLKKEDTDWSRTNNRR